MNSLSSFAVVLLFAALHACGGYIEQIDPNAQSSNVKGEMAWDKYSY